MLNPEAAFRKDTTNVRTNVLQHRHFALIARIIADDFSAARTYTKAEIIARFAQSLANTNNVFSYERFVAAAGRHE